MKVFERVRIQPIAMVEMLTIPDELIATLDSAGLKFKLLGNSLISDDVFDPHQGKFAKTHKIVAHFSDALEVVHSVWPEYNDTDYQNAALWAMFFPDCWHNEIDCAVTCSSCNRKTARIDPRQKVEEVKGAKNRPFLNVNGQFKIIRRDVADSFVNSLSGLHVEVFDKVGKYMYLLPTSQLSSLIIRDDEVFGFKGFCDECGFPKFDMYFGPLRYPAKSWNGNDIVFEPFHRTPVFSHKAANLILGLDKNIVRGGVVFLE